MKAVFIELPAFERHRTRYFDDDTFYGLQEQLIKAELEARRTS